MIPLPQAYQEPLQHLEQLAPAWKHSDSFCDVLRSRPFSEGQLPLDRNAFYLSIPAKDIQIAKAYSTFESSIEHKFKSLAKKWYEEIGGDSSLTRITSNLNYLKIIKLGENVIPLIINELRKEPAPWFLALQVLAERDDIGRDTPGEFHKIAQEWIQWSDDKDATTPAI